MLIDSHCHLHMLDLADFSGKLENVLTLAQEAGVQHMLSVCVDLDEYALMQKIASEHANISISLGVHPCTIMQQEPSVDCLIDLAQDEQCIAIGETGLDYYHAENNPALQQNRFRNHISAAKTLRELTPNIPSRLEKSGFS